MKNNLKFDPKTFIDELKRIDNMIQSETGNKMNQEIVDDLGETIFELLESLNPKTNQSKYNHLDVNIKLSHPNAVLPTYAKDGDAGMDMVVTEILWETNTQIAYGTGVHLEIPPHHFGFILPRSSIKDYDLTLSNSVGFIDPQYRGEIKAVFNKKNTMDSGDKFYKVGERCCQLVILPYPTVNLVLQDELNETERGVGGFGHTGK